MASRRSARVAAMVTNATLSDPAPLPAPPPASRKRKAAAQAPAEDQTMGPPSTPRRRRTVDPSPQVPPTPTPDAVKLIAEEAHTRQPKPAAVTRLADPSRTNAVLRSPKTKRLVTSAPAEPPSPSKLRLTPATTTAPTTTANILEEACAHLIRVDPRMKPLIDKHHCRVFSAEGLAEQIDPFEALCSSIISQQVSGAAARSIKARFIALFNNKTTDANSNAVPNGTSTPTANPLPSSASDNDTKNDEDFFPTAAQVAATDLPTLRTAGLSQRKAEYLQGLASQFASGELTAQMLADAPYEELLARLTAVRGLGRWSVEMFSCFALKRMDVFSTGDLGVQRGMAAFVGRDVARLKNGGGKNGGKWKYMSEREMEEISERFRPYRSLFMWYMWRVEETDISTME